MILFILFKIIWLIYLILYNFTVFLLSQWLLCKCIKLLFNIKMFNWIRFNIFIFIFNFFILFHLCILCCFLMINRLSLWKHRFQQTFILYDIFAILFYIFVSLQIYFLLFSIWKLLDLLLYLFSWLITNLFCFCRELVCFIIFFFIYENNLFFTLLAAIWSIRVWTPSNFIYNFLGGHFIIKHSFEQLHQNISLSFWLFHYRFSNLFYLFEQFNGFFWK